ncbi:MAG: hypothetical protein K0S32_3284 [Bacteroidetes bacterium]|jgi:hypothetical protein|nr:hypothetical protein [Bacteroidota bacterium]
MKTKLLYLIIISCFFYTAKSQCTASAQASLVVTTATTVPFSAPFVVKVCSTGIAYDTTGNNGRTYYLETGAQLKLKMNSTTLVYMKTGSSLTVTPGGSSGAYFESGASITGVPNFSTSCTLVSFPAAPSCAPTGIKELSLFNGVSVYPNPAEDLIVINNPTAAILSCNIINAIGQKVKSFNVDTDKKSINISDLSIGIYYLSFSENGKTVMSRKITVVK